MGYDRHPSSTSSGYLIAAVGVGIAMFLGLLIVGATMLFNTRRVAVAREMVAVETARAARAESESRQQAMAVESAIGTNERLSAVNPVRAEFHIFLDATGAIQVDNEDVDLDELVNRLMDGDESVQTVVKLNADPKCPFEHVAAVIKKCRESGIQRVDVAP